MSLTLACCTIPPVESNYVPKGTTFTVGSDLAVYETVDKSPKKVVICAYDITGYHPSTKQVADKLSEGGFRVAMPDFFRGQGFKIEDFNPDDWTNIYAFVEEKGNWKKNIKTDLLNVLKHYKEKEGITSFGFLGFCWGGRIGIDSLIEIDDIQSAALVHPSFWKTEDAELIKKPALLVPTRDEEDMIPFFNILKKNLGEENCGHIRMDDIHHGYCSARGDFTDPLNCQRVNETLEALNNFFHKHIK